MTDRKLANFWARKFDWAHPTNDANEYYFFESGDAPIFAHEIQDYMEKIGFQWEMYCPSISRYQYRYQRRGGPWCEHIFESKWIANAEAARKALEGE